MGAKYACSLIWESSHGQTFVTVFEHHLSNIGLSLYYYKNLQHLSKQCIKPEWSCLCLKFSINSINLPSHVCG